MFLYESAYVRVENEKRRSIEIGYSCSYAHVHVYVYYSVG